MTEFALPPENMLSEQIALPDLQLALGLLHLEGAGLRVVSWNGVGFSHMSPAKARRFAKELGETQHCIELLPAIRGLEKLADRVDEILAEVAARKLEAMPAEGCA